MDKNIAYPIIIEHGNKPNEMKVNLPDFNQAITVSSVNTILEVQNWIYEYLACHPYILPRKISEVSYDHGIALLIYISLRIVS